MTDSPVRHGNINTNVRLESSATAAFAVSGLDDTQAVRAKHSWHHGSAVHAGSSQGDLLDQRVAWSLPAAFDGYVRRCVGYAHGFDCPGVEREPLSTDVVVIIGLESRLGVMRADAANGASSPIWRGSFVGGLDDRGALVAHDGTMRGIQVDMSALAARMIFGAPMHSLARQVVALEDLLGREACLLEERLLYAESWDARFRLVGALLTRRLAQAERPPADVSWAWRRIIAARGRLSVADLASEIGCSRKHLGVRFREHIGLPPKLCARMVRFQHAREAVACSASQDLAELAVACGYYDQAHMDREFREFEGMSQRHAASGRLHSSKTHE